MPARGAKDTNLLASQIVKEATGEYKTGKNPNAVALGRLGGLKGVRLGLTS